MLHYNINPDALGSLPHYRHEDLDRLSASHKKKNLSDLHTALIQIIKFSASILQNCDKSFNFLIQSQYGKFAKLAKELDHKMQTIILHDQDVQKATSSTTQVKNIFTLIAALPQFKIDSEN